MRALKLGDPSTLTGLAAVAVAFALLSASRVWMAALGIESLALAFWLWARTSPERREQLPRWAWLRRPAMALWLAAALIAVLPVPRDESFHDDEPSARPGIAASPDTPDLSAPTPAAERDPLAPLRALRSIAIVWAALELLGALPPARPYPDRSGPLPNAGPWLPAMLPAAGFLVLWRHAGVWTDAPFVRELAALALTLAAALAVLRAYSRRTWTASLRWLTVFDSALAGLLVALELVPPEVAFLLWLAAAGGRLMALAAELYGAAGRRGPLLARLWRAAGWTAGAALAWPLLAGVGFSNGRFHPIEFGMLAAPVFLASALSLRRVVEAPERRAMARPDAARGISLLAAVITMLLGPFALLGAWWGGYEMTFPGGLFALVPAALGWWPRTWGEPVVSHEPLDEPPPAPAPPGAGPREFANAVFRGVTAFEKQLARSFGALLRALGAPARDLHTGDAQEYLLFLVGVSLLALLLPLLRR